MDHLGVASRRHGAEALDALLAQLRSHLSSIELTNMGSSLKLCLVASGDADFYPRLAPTSEWDTAAAHAVVLAAGGEVVDTSFAPLRYNTKAEILNPHFLSSATLHGLAIFVVRRGVTSRDLPQTSRRSRCGTQSSNELRSPASACSRQSLIAPTIQSPQQLG